MPYTRTWAEVMMLLGTRDSDEIDDAVREARSDLAERFASILFDVEADPWVVKIPGVNVDGTQNWLYGSTDFELFGTTLTRALADLTVHPTAVSVGNSAVLHLTAPRGSVIKGFSVRVLCETGATVSVTLRKITSLGVSSNIVIVAATPGAAIQQVASGAALTEELTSGADYFLEVNLVANGSSATSAKLFNADVQYKLSGTP